jgi:hypothetical protein
MMVSKQAGPVVAALFISAVLYGSVVLMSPESRELAYGGETADAANGPDAGPTPWSADHARAQAKGTAPGEDSSTF